MAVRRGVWLVVALIFIAIMISATALVFTSLLIGREPPSPATPRCCSKSSGDLQEVEPGGVFGQFFEAPPTVRVRSWRRFARPRSTSASPASSSGPAARPRSGARSRRSATRSLTSGRRASRRSPSSNTAASRSSISPPRATRSSLDADRVARPHRHGELRALPARHARQDRRISRRSARRRIQDRRRTPSPRRDSPRPTARWRSRSTTISTNSWFAASRKAGTRRRPKCAR